MKALSLIAVLGIIVCFAQSCGRQGGGEALNLFAWSEYIPQEVIDGFTRETGVRVDYETYDSNEAMLTKLSQGSTRYDLIQPSEYAVENLIRRGMLDPLEFSEIPNLANLDPAYRNLPYDPGQKYSVPYMAGTVGIVVNSEVVKEPVHGYQDVFRDKYRGRIVVVNDNREIVSWAFGVLGIPINQVTPENLAKAKPLLAKWLPLVKVFDSDNPRIPLLSGDCDLGIVYSGDAARLCQENHKFRYVLPAEGAHEFVDNLCIPKGARNREAAQKFINYVLRPEVSKLISDKFPYTNPNAAARKLLSAEQLANPASYPAAAHLDVFHDIGAATQDIGALMSELRGGG